MGIKIHSSFTNGKNTFYNFSCMFLNPNIFFQFELSLVLLPISNLTNEHGLHQFFETKTTEANKSVKTDANGAH